MSLGLSQAARKSERVTVLMYEGSCAFCVLGVSQWIIVHEGVCVCVCIYRYNGVHLQYVYKIESLRRNTQL